MTAERREVLAPFLLSRLLVLAAGAGAGLSGWQVVESPGWHPLLPISAWLVCQPLRLLGAADPPAQLGGELAVAWGAFYLALAGFQKLTPHRGALWLLCFFPWSYAHFSEPLLLCASVWTLLYLERGEPWDAAGAASMALLADPWGLLTVLLLAVELPRRRMRWRPLLVPALAGAGLAAALAVLGMPALRFDPRVPLAGFSFLPCLALAAVLPARLVWPLVILSGLGLAWLCLGGAAA